MRPFTRQIHALAKSTFISEGPLIGKVPIGRLSTGGQQSSRQFSTRVQHSEHSSARVRKLEVGKQQTAELRRVGGRIRWQSTWEHERVAGKATQPKRSDTRPLLGVLVGASALAYVGSSIASHVGVQDGPVKSSDGVSIADVEGMYLDNSRSF